MSDRELLEEVERRCQLLLRRNDVSDLIIDQVHIRADGDRVMIDLLGAKSYDMQGDSWRSSTNIYDANAPDSEQITDLIREVALPVIQRHMVLDDLSDV